VFTFPNPVLICHLGAPMETNTKKNVRTSRILGALFVFTMFAFVILISVPHEGNPRAAHESAAASSLRTLYFANVAYEQDHPQQGYAGKLSDLSEHSKGLENGAKPAWMIDLVLAGGEKYGYKFTYSPQSTKSDGKVDTYQVLADPIAGKTEGRHFFVDETGVFRMSDTGPANAGSAVLE
jgi:hypothetical protein